MKRRRCVEGGAVHTCRPESHWRRFRAPVAVIVASLAGKLSGLHWSKGESRQRQRYWHRGCLIQSRIDGLPPAAIRSLLAALKAVATHSTVDRTTALTGALRRLFEVLWVDEMHDMAAGEAVKVGAAARTKAAAKRTALGEVRLLAMV